MSERPDPLTDDVIDRYFAGELDPEQAKSIRAYLEANASRRGYVAGLRGSLRGLRDDSRESMPAADPSWRRLAAKLDAPAPSRPAKSGTVRRTTRIPRIMMRASRATWWVGGASLLAGAVLTVVSLRHSNSTNLATSGRTYATAAGQRATVTLDDGTRVTLAPRTTLRISAFDEHTRVVSLDGEAYFEVAHAASAPFLVHTGAVHTRVLGTAFDVRHYASDAETQVAVTEGKVMVRGRRSAAGATVVAGIVARATDSTVVTAAAVDVRDYASWTTGRLVFRGAQVGDMLTSVGAWYGYDFHLADSTLMHMRVNADLEFSSSKIMFKALQGLLGVHMTFDGRVVTLHAEQKPRQAPRTTRDLERSLSKTLEFGK